ncbi:putative methyltransferase [Dinoroseobacter shibae DFL 12 = DSM 16493]|jgi:16S rRNA (guanine966-N2)-methyltransferase|uniref:Putative methyltransferase n=1 Tax=Dinoroseobacter shibae (strain DSM 16493 / NCIMB 14021 / DFL 12) TaxID=398580 RepID=A8LKM1_DINSH|nr:16S rRNA (guanine(966)-N(2))-methyltransferase RsmD [Dinoroseobacter shibae]ABV91864.1 putative methyltransferase [Dinoroseobacter shibae DFL 12 = DSM 16493]URF46842.1 16S rRNA (guanine(966)-N(2))-methyltransferase RsmD [Dinoroseobacter shibae]URF51153.1 16S rRNA (guanine(966)-N(2))-methyltransferase RsmD [Dinoroseobacter shibae]
MRIIAGRFGGRKLASLGKGDAAAHLRPTPDRVREALFSSLTSGAYGDPITGARVLDLFAGTGALGLEALSRGAAHVTFVETGRVAQRLLADNIRSLGVAAETRVRRSDACKLGPPEVAPFALVFLDPPYGQGLGVRALAQRDWIAPGALIVWEEGAPQDPLPGFDLRDQRRYGGTHVTVLEARDV